MIKKQREDAAKFVYVMNLLSYNAHALLIAYLCGVKEIEKEYLVNIFSRN